VSSVNSPVHEQDGVVDRTMLVSVGLAECRVVKSQLRQRFSVSKPVFGKGSVSVVRADSHMLSGRLAVLGSRERPRRALRSLAR
jgi:hypothetical protein